MNTYIASLDNTSRLDKHRYYLKKTMVKFDKKVLHAGDGGHFDCDWDELDIVVDNKNNTVRKFLG